MKTEYEIRILEINKEEIIKNLEKIRSNKDRRIWSKKICLWFETYARK